MRYLKIILIGFLCGYLFESVPCVAIEEDVVANHMRELNRSISLRKNKGVTSIINTTDQTIFFEIACCYHEAEISTSEFPLCYAPRIEFRAVKPTSFDRELFPVYRERCEIMEMAVSAFQSEATSLWLVRDYEMPAGAQLKIIPEVNSYLARIKLKTPAAYLSMPISEFNFSLSVNPEFVSAFPFTLGACDFVDKSTKSTRGNLISYEFEQRLLTEKIQRIYNENARFLQSTLLVEENRIPLIMHTFWHKDLVGKKYLKWLVSSMQSCSLGWDHVIWVSESFDEDQFNTQLYELGLDENSAVQIKSIHEINSPLLGNVQGLIDEEKYADASHVLHIAILKQYGGVCRSADLEVLHDLARYNGTFDFYTGLDPKTLSLTTMEICASTIQHPTLIAAESLILHNSTMGAQSQNCGEGLIAAAMMQSASTGRDIVLPPHLFCPPGLSCPGISADIDDFTDVRMRMFPDVLAINYAKRYQNLFSK